MKYKVGDRVEVSGMQDGATFVRAKGTIKNIKPVEVESSLPYGVEFDEPFSVGHILEGKAKEGHGFWVKENMLTLISESKSLKEDNMGMHIQSAETKSYINGKEVKELSVEDQISLIKSTEERIKMLEGLETKTIAITKEIESLKANLKQAVGFMNAKEE